MFGSIFRLVLLAMVCVCEIAVADIPLIPTDVPIKHALDVSSRRLGFTAEVAVIKDTIEQDAVIGVVGNAGYCRDASPMGHDKEAGTFSLFNVRKAFASVAKEANYPRYEPDLSVFEDRIGSDADFSLALTIQDMRVKVCMTRRWIGRAPVVFGDGYLKAKLELRFAKTQEVVYSRVIESLYVAKQGEAMMESLFYYNIVKQYFNNALADEAYVDAYEHPLASTPSTQEVGVDAEPGAKPSAP